MDSVSHRRVPQKPSASSSLPISLGQLASAPGDETVPRLNATASDDGVPVEIPPVAPMTTRESQPSESMGNPAGTTSQPVIQDQQLWPDNNRPVRPRWGQQLPSAAIPQGCESRPESNLRSTPWQRNRRPPVLKACPIALRTERPAPFIGDGWLRLATFPVLPLPPTESAAAHRSTPLASITSAP